jgi:hypothetical protein
VTLIGLLRVRSREARARRRGIPAELPREPRTETAPVAMTAKWSDSADPDFREQAVEFA